jgi:hypothetical protein
VITLRGEFAKDLGLNWRIYFILACGGIVGVEKEGKPKQGDSFTITQNGESTYDSPKEGEVLISWDDRQALPVAWMETAKCTIRLRWVDSNGDRVTDFEGVAFLGELEDGECWPERPDYDREFYK